jgi:hypothetical protein
LLRRGAQAVLDRAGELCGEFDLEPAHREALEVLVESLNEAPLRAAGHKLAATEVLRSVVAHVGVRAARGDLGTCSAAAPVVVTGLPRSGTTYMHQALAEFGRAVRFYEAMDPLVAVNEKGGDAAARERARDGARRRIARQQHLAPQLESIHPLRVEDPEECGVLLQHSLISAQWLTLFELERYREWWLGADQGPAYRFLRDALDVLAGGEATRWVLKFPAHLGALGAAGDTWPGATVVWVHRNPVRCVASWASLVQAVRSIGDRSGTDGSDGVALGREWLDFWSQMWDRARQVEVEEHHELQIIHVRFEDLVGDPRRVVAEVAEAAGLPGDGGNRDGVVERAVAAAEAGRNFGHRYDSGGFGLGEADLARFTGWSALLPPG